MKILLEVENVEGDDLKRILDGLDMEAPPSSDTPPTAPQPVEDAREPNEAPGPQPKLGPPGLAWGSQSNTMLDADGPDL